MFGEGTPGTIMFIGEGPGLDENESGRPFTGAGGSFLRSVLANIGLKSVYLTYVVCCRSFSYQYDGEGKQRYRKDRGVMVPSTQDEAPKPSQSAACLARLHEEIYLVDPILIVTLGPVAAEVVLGHQVKALQSNSTLRADVEGEQGTILRLPGVGRVPLLTPKGSWRRKVRGEHIMPTAQATVTYPVIPLIDPGEVTRRHADGSIGSPKDSFAKGLSRVKKYFAAYVQYTGQTMDMVLTDDTVSIEQLDEYREND